MKKFKTIVIVALCVALVIYVWIMIKQAYDINDKNIQINTLQAQLKEDSRAIEAQIKRINELQDKLQVANDNNDALTDNLTILQRAYNELLNQPPKTIIEVVTENITVEKEVLVGVPLDFKPKIFQSEEELRDWVTNWKPWIQTWSVAKMNSLCEAYCFAMLIDAVNDGYLMFGQIDPSRNHMIVAVPIYSINRYLFIEPQTKEITKLFMGREWAIN